MIHENITNHMVHSFPNIFVLTKSSLVPFKIPAPPEAKLTPATVAVVKLSNPFPFNTNDRYGGAVGNPTFSAIKSQKSYS